MLEVRDDRNGGAVHEGQTPSGTGLQSCVKALVATEVKVTESTTARDIVITGLIVPLVHNLTISVAYSSTDHRVPHFGGNQGLQRLTKPSKIRVGVGDTEDRTMNRNNHTFRKRNHFNREIAQTMELLNLLVVTEPLSECVVHNPGILCDYLFLGFVEEVLVEVVNKPGLAECLETEVHNPIPSVNSGRARGEITDRLSHTGVKHLAMDRLVEVFK
jgi:hypothetical protein